MAFTKFASAEVLGVKASPERIQKANLEKFASYDDYRTDDGYLYVRVRAISSRVNKNNDGWPADELAKSYRTFIGKPIFVDHHNSDPQKARGVVVDAALHVEDMDKTASLDPYYATAPDEHKPPTWIELLLETDAKTFPKLAKAVIDGDIDGVSMGCNVERSKCSVCANWARSPEEYCSHVVSKGAHYDHVDKHGNKVSKKSYEDCYDIGFFEISYVFDPADETALIFDKKHSRKREIVAAVHKEGQNPEPQSEMTTLPDKVDTLRQEQVCPICGSMMDNGICEVCNYEEPPEGFDNPDLGKAKEVQQDLTQQPDDQGPNPDQVGNPGSEPQPMAQGGGPSGQGSPLPQQMSSFGGWKILTKLGAASNEGGRINTQERPILPVTRQNTDKPLNVKTISNPTKPVESHIQGEHMKTADGTGATPAGSGVSADKRVDVEGIGAVDNSPEKGTQHVNVEKEVKVEGPHTDTWSGNEGDSLGQHTPVTPGTPEFGPIGRPVSHYVVDEEGQVTHVAGPAFPDHDPSRINLEAPLKEEVGDHTMTFGSDDFHIRPDQGVTDEDGNIVGGPMGVTLSKDETRAHIFRAMKIAEAEVNLGLTSQDEKFERAAELEEEAPAALVAREETLSRVVHAGLNKTAKLGKTASRMPSLRDAEQIMKQAGVTSDEPTTDDVIGW